MTMPYGFVASTCTFSLPFGIENLKKLNEYQTLEVPDFITNFCLQLVHKSFEIHQVETKTLKLINLTRGHSFYKTRVTRTCSRV